MALHLLPRAPQALRICGTLAVLLHMGAAGARADAPQEPVLDSMRVLALGSGGQWVANPVGVAIDTGHHEIVLANTGGGRVEFFDYRGRPRGSFLHEVLDPEGRATGGVPQHVAVDREGRVLVADGMSPDLWVRDFRGRLIQRVVLPAPDDSRATGGAGAMAVAGDGRIFVASRARQGRVHVLSPDFEHLATWGEPGEGPGQIGAITGLACLGDSEVVMTCLFTTLGVQIFGADGRYRRGFGLHEVGAENVSQPMGVTTDPAGRIWVLDSVRRTIQTYDAAGTLLGVTGSGDGPGSWLYPSALAGDGRGLFALADTGGNRLRLLWIRPPAPSDRR